MTQKNKLNMSLDKDFFENIIIYNALMDDIYLSSIIDVIKPEYFKNPEINLIIKLITDFYKKRSIAPNLTELKAHLIDDDQKKAFKNVVTSFKQMDSSYNKDELYENTEQFFKEKAVYNAVLKTATDYSKEDNNTNSAETLKLFEEACNISLVEDLGHNYFEQIDKHIEEIKQYKETISSGYKWLDHKLGGGFLKDGRAMYVFSGVTNSGKSLVLGNLAANMLRFNKTILLISMEMSEAVYSQRISSQMTRIPFSALRNETDGIKDYVTKYRLQFPQAKLIIKEYPPKAVTVNHLKAYIKKLISKKRIKPDAIIVDYVNLIQSSVVTGNSYTDIKTVSEELRALSYIFKCPVITATQLNRSAYEELNPGIETTSESMGLAMTADFQASVWSSEQDKELGIIHMGIQKSRFGQNFGNATFKIDYDTLAIDEMDNDTDDNTQLKDAQTILGVLSK